MKANCCYLGFLKHNLVGIFLQSEIPNLDKLLQENLKKKRIFSLIRFFVNTVTAKIRLQNYLSRINAVRNDKNCRLDPNCKDVEESHKTF